MAQASRLAELITRRRDDLVRRRDDLVAAWEPGARTLAAGPAAGTG